MVSWKSVTALLAAGAFVGLVAVHLQAADDDTHKGMEHHRQMMMKGHEGEPCEGCTEAVKKWSADLDTALAAAQKAVEADHKDVALAELKKAKGLVADLRAGKVMMDPHQKMMTDKKAINAKCPIMGGDVPAHLTAALTREFRDKVVGFCCAGCPAQWEKLSDEEKAAKLAAGMKKSG